MGRITAEIAPGTDHPTLDSIKQRNTAPPQNLLSYSVAERKRLNLGNLNPIYERELTKLDVHQEEGRRNVSKDGAGRRGCRHR